MSNQPRNEGRVDDVSEEEQSLWLLTISPTIWAVHLLASYLTAAIWCAKVVGPSGSLDKVRIAIAIYTAIALIGIFGAGWVGYRKHTFGTAALPHDFDTPQDRHRFLGFATLLLSALSAAATIFVALVAVFVGECH